MNQPVVLSILKVIRGVMKYGPNSATVQPGMTGLASGFPYGTRSGDKTYEHRIPKSK